MTTAQGPLVLLVEDERQMRRFLRASLTSHGFRLVEAETAQQALALATSHNPEVVLLDLGLPDGDGIAVALRLREWSRVPIIILSARGRETDKVAALDAGADDYLTKPFGVNELLARIRVSLRRAAESAEIATPVLQIGALRIDLARREVTLDGHALHLTPNEYRLLTLLARNAGKVLTHRQILKEVWGPGHVGETHYLRVYMAQLRRKIEADPARPQLLVTEPSVGYRLRDRDSPSPRTVPPTSG
jgi:two-component system KDP operon response regulator KdpE